MSSPALSRVLNFCSELLVFDVGSKNQPHQCIAEEKLIFAVIKAEAHFVKVGREMFRRDFMPRAHNAALEQRESGFYSVRMNVAVRVFPRVVNRFVLALLHVVERPRIDSGFVGQNHFHMAANIGVDNLLHGLGLRILSSNQTQIAVALSDANNYLRFVLPTPAALLARNIGFVNLDRAAQLFRRYLQHGRPDTMAEIPRRLVADSERALNLAGGHSLFGFAEQVRRKEPFSQGQMRIVKDGAGRCAELVVAGVTIVLRAIGNRCGRLFTTRAGNTLAPAQCLDIAAAGFVIPKLFNQVYEIDSVVH
jgi:hypothetical protein